MDKIDLIPRIKEMYSNGENIIQFLRNEDSRSLNNINDILISYDFQAGSYIKLAKDNPSYIDAYTNAIVKTFKELGSFNTLLEVGAGEATTLGNLVVKINNSSLNVMGFDISWSRVNYGKEYLKELGAKAELFIADLFNIPLSDSSIDVVYTSHSIEPNGGKEKEALRELYRVTGKYLVLLEPTDEFANEEGKIRMKKNGYIQNIKKHISDLKYNLITYKPFEVTANPLNPTGLYIIKKEKDSDEQNDSLFCCPISKEKLTEYADHFFCRESLISYPKIMGIPCLYPSYGILTSKHE